VFYYLTILYAAVFRGVGNTALPFFISLVSTALNIALNYVLIYGASLGPIAIPALDIQGAALGTVLSQAAAVAMLVWALRRDVVPGVNLPLRVSRIDGALSRELAQVGAPAALDMVILNAGFISLIGMLGRIDQLAVAAHGIGLRVQSLAFVPGMSVSQATGAMVGQALGAGRVKEAREVARASMVLCTLIMSSLALAIILAARSIVGVFDVAPGTLLEDYSVDWMRLLGYGMPPVGVYIALGGVLRGAGATGTSLRINAIVTLGIMIPLGAILGLGFDLGAVGVWAAFPIAFACNAALMSVAYRRGRWVRTGVRLG
jgi:putative MATE family efflux protein